MSARSPRLAGRLLVAVGAATLALAALPAAAAQPAVGLGTAGSYAVLAGSTVTNTGPSVLSGDLGVSPGTAIVGFPPGTATGATHSADAPAAQAKIDTATAYDDAAGRSESADGVRATELGGLTLQPGVYQHTTLGITGTLTLDAAGDPNAVFVFQSASTLITASDSQVALINGAQACNVFWQVASSATLGTRTAFVGTVLARTSITANTRATVQGRLLALDGAVTLDDNTITRPNCAAGTTTTTSTTTTSTTTTSTTTTSTTSTPTTSTPTTSTSAPPATPTTSTSAPPATPTTSTPTTSPVGAVPAVPVTGVLPTDAGSAGGATSSPLAPGDGSGDAGRATPPRAPGSGDGSSTPITRLPETGSERSGTVTVGALAIVLGATMVHRSKRLELQ